MILTRDIQVAGPFKLGDGVLGENVARMFDAAQAARFVPRDRAPLSLDSDVLFIEDARKIVAAAVFFDAGQERLWLDFIYTDAPLRGRGLGRALLRQLAVIAKARGFKRILFGTSIDNAAMRHLAQRVGFVEDSINLAIEIEKDAA